MAGTNITIFDIAREAGVSIATVSRAFSDQYNPRSAKQRLVREIADKYNYTPNVAARALGSGSTKTLAIVLQNITNPYYCELFNFAEAEASRRGYVLFLQRLHEDPNSYRPMVDQLISRRPDGLILTGAMVEEPVTEEKLRAVKDLARYMPIVSLGRPVGEFPMISIQGDMRLTGAKMVNHLYALGHRRIAMVGGAEVNQFAHDREQGYHETMNALGLTPRFDDPLRAGHTPEDGAAGVLRMFSGDRADWPTALCCNNDLVALGALRQLSRMGLRVPEDVAIVGCDNQFFSPYTLPALTTVDLGLAEQGRLAVEYALKTQNGTSFHHEVDSTLIIRESCGASAGIRRS